MEARPQSPVVTHLQVEVPLPLASQQCIQHGSQALFLPLALPTDDIAECTHAQEEVLVQVAGTPTRQVGQVQVHRGASSKRGRAATGSCGDVQVGGSIM